VGTVTKPARLASGSPAYRAMREITEAEYRQFLNSHKHVQIENVRVELRGPVNVKTFEPPKEYTPESSTVWSFPDRGDWATHRGNYRGNWSPYIPRNLILRYTEEGDWVLDQMCGSGTTLVECKLLKRNAIGVDINPDAIMVTRDRLNFRLESPAERTPHAIIRTYVGDARNLNEIADNIIDLVAFHPPYASIIGYSNSKVPGDLSALRQLPDYLAEMEKVACEAYRVLKPGKYCAMLIGDTRKHAHYVPIAFPTMERFLAAGFILKEDIIKQQWKMKTTRERWKGRSRNFYLIAHEHLFVFRKPEQDQSTTKFKHSSKWW